MNIYEISEKRLLELLAAELELEALKHGGVDSWSWYGDSCVDFLGQLADEYGLDIEDIDFKDLASRIAQLEFKQKEE